MAAIKDPENTLIIETTKGHVVIELRPDLAPKHVERIKQLAREGFYDGIVVPPRDRGLHGADRLPQGTGTGGSKLSATCRPSSTPSRTCAACARWRARQSPNSANSQFFICFDDASFLDKQYTVWGKVIEGMDNVDKIKRGEPVQNPDKMISVKVAADA